MIVKYIFNRLVIYRKKHISRLNLQLLRNAFRKHTADFMFKIFLHIYIFKSISVLFQTFCIRLKRKLPHIPFTAASMYQFLPE